MTDKVFAVGGDDDADDPGYGFDPVKVGPRELIAEWLRSQEHLDGLSVIRGDGRVLWARDYLEQVDAG